MTAEWIGIRDVEVAETKAAREAEPTVEKALATGQAHLDMLRPGTLEAGIT